MEQIKAFFTNYWILCAATGWLTAQIIKIFTGFFKMQKFSIKTLLFGSGGMPSSHTASVSALCTAFAVSHGLGSAPFAITGILLIIVMIDATGVRRETGKQSRALNQIMDELFSSDLDKLEVPFKELIGHTPLQVFFGFLTGVITTLLLSLIPGFIPAIV